MIGVALLVVGSVPSIIEWKSPTALIPAFLGLLLAGFGVAADQKPAMSHHFMHGAAMVALLGVLGSAGSFLARRPSPASWAGASQLLSVVLCGVFLFWAIQSFKAARLAREAKQA